MLVKENGRSRMITKRAALAKLLVNLGISGNVSVTKLLLLLMARGEEVEHRSSVQSQAPSTFPSLSDIKAAIKYLEEGIEPPQDDDSSSKSSCFRIWRRPFTPLARSKMNARLKGCSSKFAVAPINMQSCLSNTTSNKRLAPRVNTTLTPRCFGNSHDCWVRQKIYKCLQVQDYLA